MSFNKRNSEYWERNVYQNNQGGIYDVKLDPNNNNNKLSIICRSWDKYVYTFCILFMYLAYGITLSLFGPAMVDMKFLFHTSMTLINLTNTFGNIGYLTGSLCGFLYKYINRQFTILVMSSFIGIFVILLPNCPSIYLFWLAFFFMSVGGGVWDSSNATWAIEMWKKNSPPILCLSQMMCGAGSIIAPLLLHPYLYGDLSNSTDTTSTTPFPLKTTTVAFDATTPEDINYSIDRRQKLIIPFTIGGIIALIIPSVLLVMFFVKRYKVPEKLSKIITAADEAPKKIQTIINPNQTPEPFELSSKSRIILIILVALSLNSYGALEIVYFTSSSTYYQYIPIKISAPTAAILFAVMTGTYTAGRGVSAYISSKLKPETMITYHCLTVGISLAILFFGQNSLTCIWIGNTLIGYGFSAMWPCYFSLAEKYIKLTDKINSVFAFTSALFLLISPIVIGPLIEKHPSIFLYLQFAYLSMTIVLFIIIMYIVKSGQKYPRVYKINN